jgi:hypothetical protein
MMHKLSMKTVEAPVHTRETLENKKGNGGNARKAAQNKKGQVEI